MRQRRRGAGEQAEFEWDSSHQLRKATVTRQGVTQETEYEYDALGRRTRKRDAFGVTEYLWDGDLLLHSQRGAKQVLYFYEADSFVLLATQQDGAMYWYHCDQIGTPQELTEAQGRVVWATQYQVWGEAEMLQTGTGSAWQYSEPLPQVEQPFRFQGQQYDVETGLHYNRFRYYDPAIGRFISQDPIGLNGGNNLFIFERNPLAWIDPVGLRACQNCRPDPCGIAKHDHQPSPRPTDNESHHIIQDKWAKVNIGKPGGYSTYGAPAILLENSPHDIANNRQNTRRDSRVANGQPRWGTSLREEFNNASGDLRAAGVSEKCRKRALKKAFQYFYNR
ncbi:RHS repeat-associated core domain-containing protein [Massilia sp. W12]|uniref:RHS repeat-associated core domain-containing protein n=1 Tax=Massilia sp. W12 TaxID=3126507 RepID=UPI0030CDFA29